MSIAVMTYVWQNARFGGGKLLVLLALADFARDDGTCWPSVRTLAAKARLSERQTQYVLSSLEGDAWITRSDVPGKAAQYTVNVVQKLRGAETAPVQSPDTGGVQPTAPKPLEPSYKAQSDNSSGYRPGSRRNPTAIAHLEELRDYQRGMLAERKTT